MRLSSIWLNKLGHIAFINWGHIPFPHKLRFTWSTLAYLNPYLLGDKLSQVVGLVEKEPTSAQSKLYLKHRLSLVNFWFWLFVYTLSWERTSYVIQYRDENTVQTSKLLGADASPQTKQANKILVFENFCDFLAYFCSYCTYLTGPIMLYNLTQSTHTVTCRNKIGQYFSLRVFFLQHCMQHRALC